MFLERSGEGGGRPENREGIKHHPQAGMVGANGNDASLSHISELMSMTPSPCHVYFMRVRDYATLSQKQLK